MSGAPSFIRDWHEHGCLCRHWELRWCDLIQGAKDTLATVPWRYLPMSHYLFTDLHHAGVEITFVTNKQTCCESPAVHIRWMQLVGSHKNFLKFLDEYLCCLRLEDKWTFLAECPHLCGPKIFFLNDKRSYLQNEMDTEGTGLYKHNKNVRIPVTYPPLFSFQVLPWVWLPGNGFTVDVMRLHRPEHPELRGF